MKRNLLTLLFLLIGCGVMVAQTSLEGKVTEEGTGEPIIFGTVALYKNDVLITGTETDFDGNYFFSNLDPGTYDVEASYVGYTASRVTDVVVKAGKTNTLNLSIAEGETLEGVTVIEYKVPLIDKDNTSSGATVTAESIKSLPIKDLNQIAATSAGVASQDGGAVSIRGSRSNETVYFVDGIRVRSASMIPQSEIEQLQIITGGIEAKYGDVTGGVISATSKGPSNRFSGGVELETSEYLDPYGYNLVTANLSGPILRNEDGISILGYRFSGQYRNIDETSPSAVGVYRAPESVIAELEQNPLTPLGNSTIRTAETLRAASIGSVLDARPNETLTDINLTGKIDARISDAIDLSVSGGFIKVEDRFTPGSTLSDSGPWYMFNWTRNPYSYSDTYRGNFRFRHKLGKQGSITQEEKDSGNASNIRNISYMIQFGYEKIKSRTEDLIHEDRFFDYGYIGRENYSWTPQILPIEAGSRVDTLANWADTTFTNPRNYLTYHQAYTQLFPEDEERLLVHPDYNPILGNYSEFNSQISTPAANTVWSGLFGNVGQVYNSYSKSEQDIYTLNLTAGFDFLPGGSEKGRHNIQFGFMYEQRVNRGWSISPFGLWQVGQDAANRHLIGIDYDNQIGTEMEVDLDGNLKEFPIFAPEVNIDGSSKFYSHVRELLGKEIYEYVNISDLTPDQLSLDMFSASELNELGVINYFGYDYLGNKIGTDVKFDDFFSSSEQFTNSEGVTFDQRTFNVAPNQPIYFAGYVQDKFSFRDVIFSLGVRMDYYDANTKVLKDPYSLYEIESASDFYSRTGQDQPVSVGDDYKVYVDGEESDAIVGFRQGDTWFDRSGTAVSGGNVLFGGGLVYPSYIGRQDGSRLLDIQDANFDINTSFEDYKPQINVMPRIAFSFPISDDAGFFMHYDVLYSRPPSNTIATALDYFYFNNLSRINPNGNPANNPNLRPQRTVDYELGFQQKISQTSAIKMSAFYKEIKDLIQQRVYTNLPAPLNSYSSYGNLDFSTIKGFSFSLDRRRTNNLQLNATYTLQFANGSGSDANSSNGLNNRGPIRNLSPLNIDERHRITAVIDYRYSSGKRYTGPRIAGKDIFANAGLNINLAAVSGRPWTQRAVVDEFGGTGFEGAINGNRLPWTFNIDARIDKSFSIKTSEESSRTLNFNVYLRVQNLLDTKNVRRFYSFSGDPEDDGYLQSQFGQARINGVIAAEQDVQAFLDAYQWRLNSPGNFFFPRRIYLGTIIDF